MANQIQFKVFTGDDPEGIKYTILESYYGSVEELLDEHKPPFAGYEVTIRQVEVYDVVEEANGAN